jgi:hypothetical protein
MTLSFFLSFFLFEIADKLLIKFALIEKKVQLITRKQKETNE